MKAPGFTPGNSAIANMTIIAVVKSSTSSTRAITSMRDEGGGGDGWTFRYNSPTEIMYFHVGHSPNLTYTVTDQFNVLVIRREGLDVEIGVNGSLDAPVTLSGYEVSIDDYLKIGYEAATSSRMDGDIAELIIRESALSEEDLDDIVNYLLNEYNITP